MAAPLLSSPLSYSDIVNALLARHPTTLAQDLGVDLGNNTPSPLFHWFCAALLFSARISWKIAAKTVEALAEQGWTTAQAMAETTWEQRVKVINHAGYARYDESTSRMLGEDVSLLIDHYGGDLRRLREEAQRDPARERQLLKRFKGIGDVGVDIFFREVQQPWEELRPFADRRALEAAEQLGLPRDAQALAALVAPEDFPRLVNALVKTSLQKDYDAVRQSARGTTQRD